MLAAELHVHSQASHDGYDPIDLILEQAAGVGLDVIAITDHDVLDPSLEASERAAAYDLVGIPGMEITTEAGHLLAIGIDSWISPGQSFSDTVAAIHQQDGIAVVPHPFQESRKGVSRYLRKDEMAVADAIEVYNSRLLTGRSNRQARRFAAEYGLPMTAGSDAHISEMVGQARTLVGAESAEVSAILDAVRAGKTTIEGKRTPWHISFKQAAAGMGRRIRNRLGRSDQ